MTIETEVVENEIILIVFTWKNIKCQQWWQGQDREWKKTNTVRNMESRGYYHVE